MTHNDETKACSYAWLTKHETKLTRHSINTERPAFPSADYTGTENLTEIWIQNMTDNGETHAYMQLRVTVQTDKLQ